MAREQRLRIGMQGHLEQGRLVCHLHNTPEIHHRHTVADVLDDRQIVRDEEIRQLEFVLQVHHEVDDLGLDRHVQRRHRLITHDELRAQRQSTRNAYTLALPARELVRKRMHEFGA